MTTFGFPLYDFMFVCVICIQVVLIYTKRESRDEFAVIMIFHLVWFGMEVFKTHPEIGSRAYPGEWFFKLRGVPLFGGFMYSAVGSFLFQAWDRLQVQFRRFPPFRSIIYIAILIYINFFSHHFLPDVRYILFGLTAIVAWYSQIYYTVDGERYSMSVLLWLFGAWVALWFAENLATFWWAWVYPNQQVGRDIVSFSKIWSWLLLFIVSIVIVCCYKMKFGRNKEYFVEEE